MKTSGFVDERRRTILSLHLQLPGPLRVFLAGGQVLLGVVALVVLEHPLERVVGILVLLSACVTAVSGLELVLHRPASPRAPAEDPRPPAIEPGPMVRGAPGRPRNVQVSCLDPLRCTVVDRPRIERERGGQARGNGTARRELLGLLPDFDQAEAACAHDERFRAEAQRIFGGGPIGAAQRARL